MPDPAPQSRQEFTSDLFAMWRCVIALAHADGTVQDEERKYLENSFRSLDRVYALTEENKNTFASDLETPQDVSTLLKEIKAPETRAMVITLGQMLVWADGLLTEEEEALLKKLDADQMASVDMEKLRGEIRLNLAAARKENAEALKSAHAEGQKQNFLFRYLDRMLLKMGVDILE